MTTSSSCGDPVVNYAVYTLNLGSVAAAVYNCYHWWRQEGCPVNLACCSAPEKIPFYILQGVRVSASKLLLFCL